MHSPDSVRPKWLTVAQLKRVLATMPDDLQLIPNIVGNLAVCREDVIPCRLGEHIGHIDFLNDGEFKEYKR